MLRRVGMAGEAEHGSVTQEVHRLAIEELVANSGTQFSPAVVEAVLRVLREDPLTAGARGPRAVVAA